MLNAVSVGDDLVVAGGFAGALFQSTILTFDGNAWAVATTPEAPGQVTGIARLGDRWIAVGNGLPDIREGFIWDSADGRTWGVVQTIEDAALYDVAIGEGVVVAVGALLDDEMEATAAAWSSTDGTTWEPADVEAADGTSIAPVTMTPDGFAATGDRPLGQPRPFWSATAASSWTAEENDLDDQLLPVDLVPWNEAWHWSARPASRATSIRSSRSPTMVATGNRRTCRPRRATHRPWSSRTTGWSSPASTPID